MSKVSVFFDKLWEQIAEFFGDVWDWTKPILKASLEQLVKSGGATLIEAAENAVRAAQEAEGASGSEKFEMAFEAVKQTVEDSGQKAATSAINLAIEMAVAKLKSELEE